MTSGGMNLLAMSLEEDKGPHKLAELVKAAVP